MEIMSHEAFPLIATLLQVFAALFVVLLGFGSVSYTHLTLPTITE